MGKDCFCGTDAHIGVLTFEVDVGILLVKHWCLQG